MADKVEGTDMSSMKAVVFKGKDHIGVEEVRKPVPGAGEAVIRITTTTICGTDVHIVRGEYPVQTWAHPRPRARRRDRCARARARQRVSTSASA